MPVCSSCGGHKGGMVHVNLGPQSHRWEYRPCSKCQGTCGISDTEALWTKQGKLYRDDRVHRRCLSQKEEATRLGISVIELSKAENGRIDPVAFFQRDPPEKVDG